MASLLPAQSTELVMGATWRARRPARLWAGVEAELLINRYDGDVEEWPVALHALGTVPLPDGRIVVGEPDPLSPDAGKPIAWLEPGDHEVFAGVATIEPGHIRVALLVLLGSGEPIAEWRNGTLEGQDIATLKTEHTFFGFSVDGGTACIGNPVAFGAAAALIYEGLMGEVPDGADARFSEAVFDSPINASIVAGRPDDGPVAISLSGWGDGLYPTWLGLDAGGNVSVLVVDYLLAEDDPHPPPEV